MENETQERVTKILELYISKGNADEEVVRKFRDWFANDGHIYQKYKALETLFEEGVNFDHNPSQEVIDSLNKLCIKMGLPVVSDSTALLEQEQKSRTKQRRRAMWRVAAVVIPFIAISAVAVFVLMPRGDKPLDTLADSYKTVEMVEASNVKQVLSEKVVINRSLPDSSSIWINESSELKYSEDFIENRTVELVGEAYMEVPKKYAQNFIVQAEEVKVIVTGTTLNVASYPNSSTIIVSLYEGYLEIESLGSRYFLSAGEELKYNKISKKVTIEPIAGRVPKWLDKVVSFKQMRVDEIFSALETTYGVPIIVENSRLTDEIMTFSFEQNTPLNDLMLILSQMSSKFLCTHDKDTNNIVVIAK